MTLSAWDEAKPHRGSSDDARIAKRLVEALGEDGAHRAVDALVSQLTNVELAALAEHWPTWGRAKQLAPSGEWRSWGDLTARGFGKTKSKGHFINDEVQAGRVKRIGLCAQSEAKTIDVQVYGLIETAPPWCRPTWEVSSLELTWPNGASARAFTPEAPDIIRSENLDLAWLSELQSWPTTTREEAYSNFLFATRVGNARTIWDATPKKGHPILKRLLARAEKHPDKHFVVRGTIYENPHLVAAAVEAMEAEYAGTQKGREELLGEMLDESEAALVKQEWIDINRRERSTLVRRVIAVDPATTGRAGSDHTGIIDVGLSVDDKALVLGDLTDKYDKASWGPVVLDAWEKGDCDLVVVEINKGGDLCTNTLRLIGQTRGLRVEVVDDKWTPHRLRGVVFVREIYSRGPKEDRAAPLATAYERGRVCHVRGADLSKLEETLTTWEPAPGHRSPDRLDALVHAVGELLGFRTDRPDAKAGFVGIKEVAAALTQPARQPGGVSRLFGGGTGGRI